MRVFLAGIILAEDLPGNIQQKQDSQILRQTLASWIALNFGVSMQH